MNEIDKSNLNFLLSASQPQFVEWYIRATENERVRAEELLIQYHLEMQALAVELANEWTLDIMSEEENFPDVTNALKKYLK